MEVVKLQNQLNTQGPFAECLRRNISILYIALPGQDGQRKRLTIIPCPTILMQELLLAKGLLIFVLV